MADVVRAAVEKTTAAVRHLGTDSNRAYWGGMATGDKLNLDYFAQKFAY
jgi:hypothetical protein